MEHHQYELALDSLIELSDVVEDRFTYKFWLNLDMAAGLRGLMALKKSSFCDSLLQKRKQNRQRLFV